MTVTIQNLDWYKKCKIVENQTIDFKVILIKFEFQDLHLLREIKNILVQSKL